MNATDEALARLSELRDGAGPLRAGESSLRDGGTPPAKRLELIDEEEFWAGEHFEVVADEVTLEEYTGSLDALFGESPPRKPTVRERVANAVVDSRASVIALGLSAASAIAAMALVFGRVRRATAVHKLGWR